MRITKEQQHIVDSLRCERLTSDLENKELVKGFENCTNPNLADYLKNEAWDEDLRGDVTYYLVKNQKGEALFYFSLKCGAMFEDFNEQRMEKEYRFWKELKGILEQSIDGDENFQKVRSIIENLYMGREVQDEVLRDVVKKLSAPVKQKMDMLLQDRAMDQNKNIVRVSATLAGVELVQFCANDKTKDYWRSLGIHQTLGRVVFWTKIVPLVMQVKSVAGCKYVFLFAADASEEGSLMTYYRDSLHFEEPENLGTNKPFYDLFCKFMCQETEQLLAGQEEFYETFNPDVEDV
jgi:hypothetical protein